MNKKVEIVCCLHIGRSGSTVLESIIKQQKKICAFNEILEEYRNQDGFPLPSNFENSLTFLKEILISKLKKNSKGKSINALYFEIKILKEHLSDVLNLDINKLPKLLKKAGVTRIVLLERKNYLRKIISEQLAQHRNGLWHSKDSSKIQPQVFSLARPHFFGEKISFLNYCKENKKLFKTTEEKLKKYKFPILKITYEEDIEHDPFVALKKIMLFLDQKNIEKCDIEFIKTTPYPVSEIISNFKIIKDELEGSEFEWMLDN